MSLIDNPQPTETNGTQPLAPQQPQQMYTQQPQLMYVQSPPRGMSITSMVLGIASIFLGLTFIVPIIGLVLGLIGRKREPAGRGFATAGIWINGIILALVVLGVILLIGATLIGVFSIPFWSSSY